MTREVWRWRRRLGWWQGAARLRLAGARPSKVGAAAVMRRRTGVKRREFPPPLHLTYVETDTSSTKQFPGCSHYALSD